MPFLRTFVRKIFWKLLSKHLWQSLCLEKFHAFSIFLWTPIDQAKIELITTFLGRNCCIDFMKGACLQIQKSANIMYVAGAFRRNRRSKKYIQGVKNGEPFFQSYTCKHCSSVYYHSILLKTSYWKSFPIICYMKGS